MNETLLNKARLNVVSLNKALINGAVERHGSSAGGGGAPSKYIRFADPAVEAVLMANGVSSDGVGITKEDAAAVTSIGTWFKGNTEITSFDEFRHFTGVTTISGGGTNGAFYQCANLQHLIIPSSVTSIKGNAFRECASLVSVGSLANIVELQYGAFDGTALGGQVDLPQVTQIGESAFRNSKIEGVNMPIATSIVTSAFYGCTSLSSVNMPMVVTIGNNAFYNCTSLAFDHLNLPNLTSLGVNALCGVKIKRLNLGKVTTLPNSDSNTQNYGDKSVLEEVVIPEGVTSIPNYSFYRYAVLSKVNIPNSVTSIGLSAYHECTSLESLYIPSGITSIGNSAFYKCTSLQTLDFPASVSSIGSSVCEGCTGLESMVFRSIVPPTAGSIPFKSTTCPIYVPDAALEVYKTATNWSAYADRIHPLSELEGSPYIQFDDAEVERVLMENNVSSDGVGITMADAEAVTDISSWFRGNTAIEFFDELKNFTGLKSIGYSHYVDSGFSGCTNLKSTTLPPSVTYLGYRAFYKTAFAEINLENVTEMHANVFLQSALTEVYAPNLAIVKEGVFKGCASLRKASFGKVAEWVSSNWMEGSFDGCSSLQEIDLSGTKLVGQYTFNNCKALTSVIGWQDLEEIQYNAFVNCTALAVDVILPKLKKADEGIFRLSGIKRVLDLGSIPEVKGTNDYDGAFSGCSNLEVIIFPASVTTFGASVTRASNNIKAHIIKSTDVPTLGSTNAFGSSTPIYVLDSLVYSYKTATNWANYSNRIRPISQLATDDPTLYAEIQQYL